MNNMTFPWIPFYEPRGLVPVSRKSEVKNKTTGLFNEPRGLVPVSRKSEVKNKTTGLFNILW